MFYGILILRFYRNTVYIRGRTGTGWQRNAADVRAETNEETSHRGDASAGTRAEREVVHG